MAARSVEVPWTVRVAVHDVAETGRHIQLVADEPTRAAIAKAADLLALPRLEASFDLTRFGREGLHVLGHVSATVGQTCIVTLDPTDNEVEEDIDLIFQPPLSEPSADYGPQGEVEVPAEDGPETLDEGAVDLGVLAVEFLILGVDPYPRKPDAVFEAPAAGDPEAHPFAALAALQKDRSRDDG